jgi:hypothetical protein
MAVLFWPLEALEVLEEEALVEMEEMSLFRLMTQMAAEVVAEVAWDPALPWERSQTWGMEARIRITDLMEAVMGLRLQLVLVQEATLEGATQEAVEGEVLWGEVDLLEEEAAEARG